MKTVILCGGKGTRMNLLSKEIPKPLARIGTKPVLWHVMKIYSHFGFNEFVLCLGYKGKMIRDYFKNNREGWKIEFVDTGIESTKSQRIKKVQQLVGGKFFLAYGDDLADVDIKKILDFHIAGKKTVTVTAVRLESPFGVIRADKNGEVLGFEEKPVLNEWINGGFMVLEKKIFDYLNLGELEQDVFKKLAEEKQLNAFFHTGKWKAMNTIKEKNELNELWESKKAFWKAWK